MRKIRSVSTNIQLIFFAICSNKPPPPPPPKKEKNSKYQNKFSYIFSNISNRFNICFQLIRVLSLFYKIWFFVNIGPKNWYFSFCASKRSKMQNFQISRLEVVSYNKCFQKSGFSKDLKTSPKTSLLLPTFTNSKKFRTSHLLLINCYLIKTDSNSFEDPPNIDILKTIQNLHPNKAHVYNISIIWMLKISQKPICRPCIGAHF